MITRKFEQSWTQHISNINHGIEKNPINDFCEFLFNMNSDFRALKKDYEEEFNKLSNKPLEKYINLFEKKFEQFFTILLKDYLTKPSPFECNYIENYNDGLLLQKGDSFKISDKYYSHLNHIANQIFSLEDEVGKIVEQFWMKSITDIKDYDKEKSYFLLAHVDRKTVRSQDIPKKLDNYNKALQGLCFSVITDKKTRLYNNSQNAFDYYENPQGAVGIIAKPKPNSIVGISKTDMLSTEFIDGKCAFNRYFEHSKVNRCFVRDNSQIYCIGTKICPPKEIFHIDADTINEIILDSKNIDVIAVFYLKNCQNKIPERFAEYKKSQEKICGHKLPEIEITSRNYLKQINLDEVFYYN